MKKTVLVALAATLAVTACTTTDPYTGEQKVSNTAGGAALGALAGAGVGLLAGGDDRRNALIGAGIGALAGGAIGNVMDRNEAELRAQLQGTGVSVTRVGDRIVLNMPSDITFATDQDSVKPQFYPVLNSVGLVLEEIQPDHRRRLRLYRFDRRRHLQLQPVAAPRARRSPTTCRGRASIPAASPSPASARPGRSPTTARRPAAPRTAASRSSCRR